MGALALSVMTKGALPGNLGDFLLSVFVWLNMFWGNRTQP